MAEPQPPARRLSWLKAGMTFFALMMVFDFIDALGAFKGIPVLGWNSPESITWPWLIGKLIKNGFAALLFGWIMGHYAPSVAKAPPEGTH